MNRKGVLFMLLFGILLIWDVYPVRGNTFVAAIQAAHHCSLMTARIAASVITALIGTTGCVFLSLERSAHAHPDHESPTEQETKRIEHQKTLTGLQETRFRK